MQPRQRLCPPPLPPELHPRLTPSPRSNHLSVPTSLTSPRERPGYHPLVTPWGVLPRTPVPPRSDQGAIRSGPSRLDHPSTPAEMPPSPCLQPPPPPVMAHTSSFPSNRRTASASKRGPAPTSPASPPRLPMTSPITRPPTSPPPRSPGPPGPLSSLIAFSAFPPGPVPRGGITGYPHWEECSPFSSSPPPQTPGSPPPASGPPAGRRRSPPLAVPHRFPPTRSLQPSPRIPREQPPPSQPDRAPHRPPRPDRSRIPFPSTFPRPRSPPAFLGDLSCQRVVFTGGDSAPSSPIPPSPRGFGGHTPLSMPNTQPCTRSPRGGLPAEIAVPLISSHPKDLSQPRPGGAIPPGVTLHASSLQPVTPVPSVAPHCVPLPPRLPGLPPGLTRVSTASDPQRRRSPHPRPLLLPTGSLSASKHPP